jgi:amino acid adenylation domain-containing protein/thioester reductase-like protein
MKYALNDIQEELFSEYLLDKNSTSYNIPLFEELPPDINLDRLESAIRKMMANHPGLRSRFIVDDDGSMKQEPIDDVDLEYLDMDDRFDPRALIRPFDLSKGSARFRIIRTQSSRYIFIEFHHICMDGTAMRVIARDLGQAYDGKELKEDCGWPVTSKHRTEYDWTFHDSVFSSVESPSLPQRDVYSDTPSSVYFREEFKIDGERLRRFYKENGFSRTAFYVTAFGCALERMDPKGYAFFNMVQSGRTKENLETVAMLAHSVPFTVKLEGCTIKDAMRESQRIIDENRTNDIPLSEVLSRYGLDSDVMFSYQKDILDITMIEGHDTKPELFTDCLSPPKSKLIFEVCEEKDRSYVILNYRSDYYTKEMMMSLLSIFFKVLAEIMDKERFDDIDVTDDRMLETLDSFNDTFREQDLTVTPIDMIEKVMREHPDDVAAVFKDKTLTYGGLDDLSARLASYIRSKGIGRDDFVAILVPRNEYMVPATIGAIRSGAAYQPMDPSYPKERLNFMLKDSGAKLVIADRSLVPLIDEYKGEMLFTDELQSLPSAELDVAHGPNDAFTILYTSGTTGTPKGCILENRNLTSFINYNARVLGFSRGCRTATYASYGFDANMMDTFCTLCTGSTLYVIPEEIRLDLTALDRFLVDNEITYSLMTTQVGRQFITMTGCKTLKHFMVGGEKLVPVNPPEWVSFLNGYGPTETTVYVLMTEIKDDNPLCPIGRPNDNVKAYVVDKRQRRVPIGVPGELYVSGPQVSRGYLNRPEKTAEVFIKNPFSDEEAHSRAYRTGDIVRWLPDGRVEYIGRNDGQVKVRGFRVELTEVESVIRKYPGIEDATVAAFDSPSGGKFIAAYVVSKDKVDVEGLHKFIGELKPPYMVPAVTMQIDAIPLNVNSKVDKRKLPKPVFESGDSEKPQNDVQQKIFDIAAEILGTDSFGIDTDLHVVGLTSVTSIRLSVILSKAFDVDMSVSDFKNKCTVRGLEQLISGKSGHEDIEELDEYPLSRIQEGLFVECIAHPGSTIYNIPLLFKLDDSVDIGRLKESIVKAVEAHPHIKARIFTDKEGNVVQRRMDDDPFTVDDIETLQADSIDDVTGGLVKPFELIGGRMFRFNVIKAKEGLYLFMDVHHLYIDGTSANIFLESLTNAYLGNEIQKETFTGFDLVIAEDRKRTAEALEEDRKYYDALLGGCETDVLPKTDLYEKGHGVGSVKFSGMETERIEEFCRTHGVTMNALMCSAMGVVLSKFCGTTEPVFTTVYNGRNDSRTVNTVGMLVRTMPILCRVEGTTVDYITKVSKTILDNMSHDNMSFAEICREYGFRPDILFVYQGDTFSFDNLCGKPSHLVMLPMDTVKSPITYYLEIKEGRLQHTCEYDKALFSEALMSSLAHAYDNAISQMLEHDDPRDIDLSDEETLRKIESFNDTAVEQDLTITPITRVEEHMRDSPDSVAVVFRDVSVTYGELNSISTRIAAFIQSKGIGKEEFVSVLVHRNEFIAVATIGVLRSGAAYQPLDPSYPKERLNFMVHDSKAKLVIADRDLAGLIDEYKGDILFTDEMGTLGGKHKHVEMCPGDAFTILYTSGTTGTPKGCILENKNIMSTVNHYTHRLEASPSMRTACYASYGFDANMMDIFVTLCSGGTLYIIPEDMRLDLPQVDRYFSENRITHGFMTTQVGRQFVSMTRCRTLKHFLVGGEKLVPVIPTGWVDFVNIYGPTETSVYVLSSHVKDDNPLCPIGRPNDNTKVYVVDGSGHQLPIGAVGELYIAGPQVSRGYLNRPDKSSEVFIRNPFSSDPDYTNAYRTGDMVRWLPDGNVEYIGRRDGQVKIRGFRVELTEVEKVIREFEGIKDATVAAFDSPSGGKFIAAYVVSDSKVDTDALNSFIEVRKPPYMVPAVTMQVDSIPLNVNGKVDRRKLPVPTPTTRAAGRMPSNEMEKKLCDIFAGVLGLDAVYADDSFFAIGGTSISASKLVVSCMNNGIPIVYKNIFDNPTPIALAAFLKGYSAKDGSVKKETARKDSGVLAYNVAENLDKISSGRIGNVLLTGATGFLGIHVLKEVIDRNEGDIICLIRGNKNQSAKDRLKTMLIYYFGGDMDESAIDRIRIVEGDITDSNLNDALADLDIDTIINCAAVVKHFAFDDTIEKVNHYGVKNLIEVALAHDAVLMHTSTLSVAGESVNGSVPESTLLREDMLDFGQDLENKYVHSKFMGEKEIIESIEKDGLKGKIFRAGNLMSRESDGEFQINFATNAFMRSLRSYVLLGCYPVDDLDAEAEFSPIDMTAKALVTLAGTPEKFTVFNGNNPHCVHMFNVIDVLRRNGLKIEIVSRDEFDRTFSEKLADDSVAGEISGLISYMGNNGESRRMIGADNRYTVKALYRLGFSWPIIDLGYIERAVKSLESFRFFRNKR